jgi:hypothetical protein
MRAETVNIAKDIGLLYVRGWFNNLTLLASARHVTSRNAEPKNSIIGLFA